MNRITVREDDEITRNWEREPAYHIVITRNSGAPLTYHVTKPHGHWTEPLTDLEVSEKFLKNVATCLTESDAHRTLETLWGLADLRDIATVMDVFRATRAGDQSHACSTNFMG